MTRSETRYLSEDENIFRVEYSGEGAPIEDDDEVELHHVGDTGTVVEAKGLVVTKTYASKDAFSRELRAMEALRQHHQPGVPRLMAANATAQRITLERILGQSFESDAGPDVDELRIWRHAGTWLRSLHQLPIQHDDDMDFSAAMRARLDSCKASAEPLLDAAVKSQLHALEEDLRHGKIPDGNRVFAHRDFRPRNWFVQRDGAFFALDFEHARPDFTEWDLVRMIPYWRKHPEFRRAFLSSYRDPRQDLSDARLRAAQFVSALQTIDWGLTHQHDEYVESGRDLAGLAAEDYANGQAYVEPV